MEETIGRRPDSNTLPEDIAERILDAVRTIRYGSVEVVVHESKVVQIERREKVRLETGGKREPGAA